MNELQGSVLFCSLPVPQNRLGCFATSFGVQTMALVLLSVLTLTVPKVQKQLEYVALVAPSAPRPAKQPVPARQAPIVVKRAPRIEARTETPAPPRLVIPPVVLPKREVAVKLPAAPAPLPGFETERPIAPQRIQRPVQTNVFAGSSAAPSLPKMAASKVQTGGFGDPNGVPVGPQAKAKGNIAAIGSFDLPSGPGYGNGTGGTRGKAGVIASTGFGNGVAEAPRPSAPAARVQTANFDLAPAVEAKKASRQVQLARLPVAIEKKPAPEYTSEARKLRVEGEVLLQVMFAANGRVRVLRVLHGLGYGLDEAATRAAEKIRFSPAQRDGQPVDSTATLHVVFQLS
jgi:TonB family protein